MAPHLSTDGGSPLDSFAALLCPPGSGLRLEVDPRRAERSVGDWLVFPSSEHPRLLSPRGGRSAAAALAQFNDSMTQAARLRKFAVGTALRAGAGTFMRRRRVAIVGRPDDASLDLFGSVLPEAVGEPVVTAVMLGPALRPNAKPVIQLMRPDGRVLAFAKVGWNDLTRSLIANEADALASWERRPPSTFGIPRSLGLLSWRGLSILLVSPVPQHVLRRGARDAMPPTEVVREVSEHGGLTDGSLGSAPYPARLIAEARRASDDRIRDVALTAVDRVLERSGDRVVRWGTGHGDWGPWNMSRTRERLHIWDWERASGEVPVGLDVFHFCFQTSVLRSGGRARSAASASLAAARTPLVELDVEPAVQVSLLQLYLTEVLLRLEAGRASGVPVREGLLSGLLDLLASDEGIA